MTLKIKPDPAYLTSYTVVVGNAKGSTEHDIVVALGRMHAFFNF